MKKLLLLLLLLFPGFSNAAVTVFEKSTTGLDTLHTSGFYALQNYISVIGKDSVMIFYVDNSITRGMARFAVYDGSTWQDTVDNIFLNSLDSNAIQSSLGLSFVWPFGNRTILVTGRANLSPNMIQEYVGFQRKIRDTLPNDCQNGGPRVGAAKIGGKYLTCAVVESGSRDTMYAWFSSDTLSQGVTWNVEGTFPTVNGNPGLTMPNGQRAPLQWSGGTKGGLFIYDYTNKDLYWADTSQGGTGGNDTLAYMVAADIGYVISSRGTQWLIPVKDSYFVWVAQLGTASGTDSLIAWKGVITGTANTGAPTVTLSNRSVIAVASDQTDGELYFPKGSAVLGTDTVSIYYMLFSSSTQFRIFKRISYNIGTSWGDSSLIVDTRTNDGSDLSVSPVTYSGGGNQITYGAWYEGADSAVVVFRDLVTLGTLGTGFITRNFYTPAGSMKAHSKAYVGTRNRK